MEREPWLNEREGGFTESQLRRSLTSAFDGLVDGVVIADISGNLLYWNQSSIRLRGFVNGEESRLGWRKLRSNFVLRGPGGAELPMEDWPIQRMIRGEEVKNLECRVSRTDTGGEWVVLYNGTIILDPENGERLIVVTLHDLTDERGKELELVRTSKLLEAIYESSTNGILIKDLEGRYLFANTAAAGFSKLSPEQLSGQIDAEMLSAESARIVREQDRAAVETGSVIRREYPLTVGPVTRIHVGTKIPYRDGTGKIIGVIGIIEDVTDARAAVEELRASESRFRELSDAIPQIVWTAGPEGGIEELNRKAAEYTGIDRESLEGWNWLQVIHPEDRERVREEWESTRRTGDPRSLQFRIRRHDGEHRWHIARETPICGEDGTVLRWYGTCTDIDDQVRAEEALRSSEDRFRTFVENTADSFFLHDDEGIVVDVNEQACRNLGYERDELIGKSPLDFDPELTVEEFKRIGEEMQICGQAILESRHRRKDGTTFPVEIRIKRFVTRGKSHSIASVHDISGRKRIEGELRESEERYRLALEAAGLGTWQHDLRTNQFHMDRRGQIHHGVEVESVDFGEIVERIHPEDRESLRVEMSSVLSNRGTSSPLQEYRVLDASGEFRWLSICCSVKYSAEGEPAQVIGTSMNVTGKKRAEEELRQSESLLRSVIDNAGIGVWVKDLEGRYTLVNRYFQELFGGPGSELLGKTAADLFSSEEASHLARNNRLVLESPGPLVFEESVRIRDRDITFLSVKFPIRDEQGRVTSIGAICTDMTSRLEMERTLRENEIRLRTLMNHASDGFFLRKRGGEILDVNQTACESLGYTREELIGNYLHTQVVGLNEENYRDVVSRLDSGETVSIEAEHRRKDGSTFPVEIRIRPFWVEGERYSVSLVRDISDRLQAEREFQSQQKFIQRIADASPHVFYVFDVKQQEVIYANRQTASDLGFTGGELEELKGKKFLRLLHPEDAQNLPNLLARWATAKDDEILESEYRLRDAQGKWHWFLGRDTVFARSPEGDVEQIIGTAQDVTERRGLEDQLREAQKMEALGQLAGGVAHDFNNLLMVVNGYCDLLLMERSDESVTRDRILAIRESGESAAALTRQLLTFGRRARVNLRVVDLNSIVTRMESLLRPVLRDDINVRVLCAPQIPSIKADENQLEQVILNLAVNARDAMELGGTLTIGTSVVRMDQGRIDHGTVESKPGPVYAEYVELSISDTGRGMEEQIRLRAFEPFFTTKEAGKGTGLGLAVVHGIVQQCGARIDVESSPGEGTRFRILFPATGSESVQREVGSPQSIQGKGTVLLIEDEESVRKIITMVLETNGYRVLSASGGEKAEQFVAESGESINLIVTDVVMPGRNGREIVEGIRDRYPGVPVLFISGYTDDEVLKRGVYSSTDAFLQKPFTPATLTRMVHELLHKEKSGRQ